MPHAETAFAALESLLDFAVVRGLIPGEDRGYYRNLLMDALGYDAPAETQARLPLGETATLALEALAADAAARGMIEADQTHKELFNARLMGLLTPAPAQVRRAFDDILKARGPQAALAWFYQLCRDCNYIRVDQIARNIRYFEKTSVGELEITINLSKPEKDPKEIAKLKNAPQVGYPKCMLCKENPGYAGRADFPARQNHRMIPLRLDGQDWFLQYSPYLYYNEHCIVLNSQHVPMKIDRGTFRRLFDFVEQFPGYFLGSNADLPIVGGSILNHDHFQGGNYVFPMDKAPLKATLKAPIPGIRAGILDWPMSCLCLRGDSPQALIDAADQVLTAWRAWTDESCGILSQSAQSPHNTVTPILRREGGEYKLMLVLRNNRTTEEFPLGIFHPHAPLHHIKKENIGLIEVMGLFILPGRLKTELKELEGYLTGAKALVCPKEEESAYKHYAWIQELAARYGTALTPEEAAEALRREVAQVCAQVLRDAGVYKQTEAGLRGMMAFLASLGYEEA